MQHEVMVKSQKSKEHRAIMKIEEEGSKVRQLASFKSDNGRSDLLDLTRF